VNPAFSEKRQKVIEHSVVFESIVSTTLSYLLGIDLSKSKALGYGSSALSFQNKLILLRDINAIDKKDKIKFDYFSAIRNQFAHNKNVVDFKSCFDSIDIGDKLRKIYRDKIGNNADIETLNEDLFDELYTDLIDISNKCFQAIFEKGKEYGMREGNLIFKETLLETIVDYKNKSEENKTLLNEILQVAQEKINTKLNTNSKNP